MKIDKITSAEDFHRCFPGLMPGDSAEEIGLPTHYIPSLLSWVSSEGRLIFVVRASIVHSTAWFALFDVCADYCMKRYALSELLELVEYCQFFSAEDVVFEELSTVPQITFKEPHDQSIELFKDMLSAALSYQATDIHCDLQGDQAVVSFRVHGHIETWQIFSADMILNMLAAAYTLLGQELSRSDSGFNRRVPQSAILVASLSGKFYHCRFQSHPIVGGLSAVLRILYIEHVTDFSLAQLGFSEIQCTQFKRALAPLSGLVLIAGPTGSGKTTTLATLMKWVHEHFPGKKLYSIEDPIEYALPWVTQMSVQRSVSDPEGGEAFVHALRAFLRMDPDIAMIGEIRDQQTAALVQTAVQTGHAILSTVHARSSIDVFLRLTSDQLAMSPSFVFELGCVNLSVYQRLFPRLCPHCATPAEECLSREQMAYFEAMSCSCSSMRCRSPSGCSECLSRLYPCLDTAVLAGIRGKMVVSEFYVPTEETLLQLSKGYRQEVYASCFPLSARGYQGSWLEQTLTQVLAGAIDPRLYLSLCSPELL